MEMAVKRIWNVPGTTTGVLEADGRQLCFTLEDEVLEQEGIPVEQWKIPGQTAIPRGRYKVVIDYSNRFQRMAPHILDVSGFTGIRIHGGVRASDTAGCIIVAEKRIDDQTVGDCAPALEQVMILLENAAANSEETYITIT